jgi:hypothetical protein
MVVMILCLGIEGLIVLFSGFPFPGLPVDVYLVGVVWLGICFSTFHYPKRPIFTLMLGWIMLVMTSFIFRNDPTESHSAGWFLYRHSVELLFIAASNLGYFAVPRNRTLQKR